MKENSTLLLKIITPENTFFSGEVYEVVIPSLAGEISILPDHIPYLSGVKPGVISLSTAKNGKIKPFCLIGDGFVELGENELTILANSATPI